MGETQEKVSEIMKNFEENTCIYGCDVKVNLVDDPTFYRSYKCPVCGNEYTAKVISEAIHKLYENNIKI